MSYSQNSLIEFDVVYPADCVEWCPFDDFHDILLCGNYQLQSEDTSSIGNPISKRFGRILMFQCSKNFSDIEKKYEKDMCGVLDIKWNYRELLHKRLFGIADADGSLSLWECYKTGHDIQLSLAHTYSNNFHDDCLALSLDWSNAVIYNDPKVIVSFSNGNLSIYDINESNFCLSHQWKAHEYEAWICAFNYFNTSVVYSGGDDCLFKVWDERTGFEKPVGTTKHHSMGVCSIQHNIHKENILATGSYDEHILLWDHRNLKSPLNNIHVGGGVWRIKWEPLHGNYLAAACMHNGCHVIDYTSDYSASRTVVFYNKHVSLTYGIDWHKADSTDIKTLASCSFYDHALHLWNFEIK